MHTSQLNLLALLLLPSTIYAETCLHYRASMPFDDTLPFEATIAEHYIPPLSAPTPPSPPASLKVQQARAQAALLAKQNGEAIGENIPKDTTLCWLKTTYEEHNLIQTIANMYPSPEEKRKDESGKGDYYSWGFRRWDMTCLPGITAHINVGLRSIHLTDLREVERGGKKKDFNFLTTTKEDVWASAWKFHKDVNCDLKALEADRLKAEQAKVVKAAEKLLKDAMVKLEKERSKLGGAAAPVDLAKKKDEAKELIRIALGGK